MTHPARAQVRTVAICAAAATLLMHLIGNPHYGFFRDELYFIICGFHPAWGYVDQPPVVPLLAAGTQLFGHSLFLLRAVPALFAAGGVYVTVLLAAEMGGGTFAQVLAALAVALGGELASFGTKVGPDEVGLWLWPLAGLYALRVVKGADPRLWLVVGAIVGICIESKYSVLFFALALVVGIALTAQRSVLRSRWFAGGIGISVALALPNFLWQAAHGFPMWTLLEAGQHGKNVIAGPLLFFFQQIVITDLLLAVVWIVGLIWLFRTGATRFLGYTYVALIGLMIVFHGKDYYPGDVYPILMAAGGVAIEAWTARARLVRPVALAAVAACGLWLLPFSLPVLGETQMVAYAAQVQGALHISRASLATEHHAIPRLPSDWADMHGWPQLASLVERVYASLPPNERAQAAIAASNYGEAAAIDFFGKGLPPVISGHNNYWLWGTHGFSGNVVVDVNGDCGGATHLFRHARVAAHFADPWGEIYEQNIPISICTGLREPLAQLWPKLRNYE